MMDEKKDAPVVEGQNASNAPQGGAQVVDNSIPQQSAESQEESGQKSRRFKGRQPKPLPMDAKVYAVSFKFYEEQCKYGIQYTIDQTKKLPRDVGQAIGIIHDRDLKETNDFWVASYVKLHGHIICRATNRKTRLRVRKLLEYLGLEYRQGIDDKLWLEHGGETVGNFSGYAMYLTHETAEAIKDGKELYDVSELWSNMTPDEVQQVRDGYERVMQHPHKVSTDELVELDKAAYDLGYEIKDFNAWYSSQDFIVRSNAKMRTIRESYGRGLEARIAERTEILRLCIYIQGPPNTGKTYAAEKALAGHAVHIVRGGGTGKFDNLRPDHDAILLDDELCPNLLNMADNFICHAYKRNRDNPVWAGHYLVVTSNQPFHEWLESCGIKVRRDYCARGESAFTKHYFALKSRFFICGLEADAAGVNHLALRSPSDRGTADEQMRRADMFMDFKRKFDATIAQYVPGTNKVDFSRIIEPDTTGATW